MADQTALLLHHEVQLRDEIRIVPVLMQDKMLRAAGAVHIPEGFPRKVLHRAVFFGFFQSDDHSSGFSVKMKRNELSISLHGIPVSEAGVPVQPVLELHLEAEIRAQMLLEEGPQVL